MNKNVEKFSPSITYTSFWLTIHFLILGISFPTYSIALSFAYGLGYYLAQDKRGHIGLSADSYALPFSIIVIVISIIIANQFQLMPTEHKEWTNAASALIKSFLISFIGGHLFSLACFFIYTYFIDKLDYKK